MGLTETSMEARHKEIVSYLFEHKIHISISTDNLITVSMIDLCKMMPFEDALTFKINIAKERVSKFIDDRITKELAIWH